MSSVMSEVVSSVSPSSSLTAKQLYIYMLLFFTSYSIRQMKIAAVTVRRERGKYTKGGAFLLRNEWRQSHKHGVSRVRKECAGRPLLACQYWKNIHDVIVALRYWKECLLQDIHIVSVQKK